MPDKKPYLDSAGLTTVVNNIKSQFAKKADLSTKSDTGHTHDNRYYTETEIDNKLAQKSDLGHTHDKLVLDSVELTMDKIANDNYAFYPQVLSSQIPESTSIRGCSLGISASPWTSLYAKDIILEGTHLSTKFSDIDSSISSLNTALSGKANTNHTHSIANVTNLQTTLDGKAAKSHIHTVSQISDLTATAKELNYMDGVTSGVQGQLDSLSAVVAGKSDSNHTHTVATTTAAGFMSANDKSKLDNIANNANNYSLPAAGTSLGGVKTGGDVTITNGLISVNDNSHTHIISNVSGLQDELNGKASASHSHDDRYYTEAEIDAKINAIVGEGAAETLDTIGEISSAIQENQTMLDTLNDAIGKKQNTITGAATTIANANLTTNRALVSNGSGKVGVSAVTATELSYLDGVTSNIQAQFSGKANTTHNQTLSTITDVTATAAELNKLDGATVSTSEINNLIGSTSNIQTQLNGKVSNTQAGVNAAINLLGTGSDIPSDNDYYISQYANGGTTTTTYHRRPVVKLYEYIKTKLESVFAAKSHTHNYAGSSSAGGSATSAVKLTSSAGSATQPVYFVDGKPTKTSYTIEANVPSGAKFTDTTYGVATTAANGLMSASDKGKLDSIASGAQKNQNAFSNVVVGDNTLAADNVTDTLTFIAGSNVTLTPSVDGDSVTFAAKDTVYTHPNSGIVAGTYKSVTVNAQGHVTAGTNPTTLGGYGITDAAAKSHTHTVDNITDLSVSAAELNFCDGVTSNVQTQLNNKCSKSVVTVSATEPTDSDCLIWIKTV